jgi:hypothetical protein
MVAVLVCGGTVGSCSPGPPSPEHVSIAPPEDPSTVPTSIAATCDTHGDASISSRYVQAQPDGVHLRLIDPEGHASSVVDQGRPAQYSRSCSVPNWCDMAANATVPAQSAGCVWYLVVDPRRYFISSPGMGCGIVSTVPVRGLVRLRGNDSLEAILRRQLHGVRTSDRVAVRGYPRADPRTIGVVRRGASIAVATFHLLGPNEWEWDGLDVCDGADLTWHAR